MTGHAPFPFEEIACWRIDAADSGPAQMALDEVALRLAGQPILRVYGWARREITFGYPQRWVDAQAFAAGRRATRRCTGGGFVEHGDDVTIALAVPANHPFAQLSPVETYRQIHEAIRAALAESNLRSATAADRIDGPACFSSPAPHDLLLETRKVLGGAQRRSKDGFLYQGSLQAIPTAPNAADRIASAFAPRVTEWTPPPGWDALREELVATRYGCKAWNERR